jgi:hypothetical protein
MHLIVPFAAPIALTSPEAGPFLQGVQLPNLSRLLARLGKPLCDAGDEMSLTAPHERAWARALGWPAIPDGLLPKGAWLARQHGLPEPSNGAGWGLLTPAHWRLGTEQISLTDPDQLGLDPAESRAYFEAIRELFESEGFGLHWIEPTVWLCHHPQLVDLPTASLDRVIGRNVDPWLGADGRARLVRRLQNEVQMLLHAHPLNDAREARGADAVNSVWLSGCGALPDTGGEGARAIQWCDDLRAPALANDMDAWAKAIELFDSQTLPVWHDEAVRSGQGSLVLCGERSSLTWTCQPPSFGSRWLRLDRWGRQARPAALLASL